MMRSFLGVPIISRGRVFGHLYLTEKQGAEEFSKEDEQLAVTLAGQAAVAIENASLYEQLTRSYEELKQSQDLLVRQEKLASLGRLAAGVAHELNNPLSAVAGFAEALQRHVSEGRCGDDRRFGDCREYLGMIQTEVAARRRSSDACWISPGSESPPSAPWTWDRSCEKRSPSWSGRRAWPTGRSGWSPSATAPSCVGTRRCSTRSC